MNSAGCASGEGGHAAGCVTCGDTATWVRVLEVDRAGETARCVDADGRHERVATELVGAVAPDDALLVHAGAAIHSQPAQVPPVRGKA